MSKRLSILSAALLLSLSPLAYAQQYVITSDTFVDSGSPGTNNPGTGQPNGGSAAFANGQDIYSYGADGKVKAVTSNYSSSYQFVSATHVLFSLPQTFWTALNTDLASYPSLLTNPNFKVTVNYYSFNDSLSVANGHGDMELHPLTQSFTTGNGTQSPLAPADSAHPGATWNTYDGELTDTWTTPGGDFDTSHFATISNTSLPVSKGAVPFSWNIASLVTNSSTRSELQNNGALIKVINEGVFPPSIPTPPGVNDFVSFYSADYMTAPGTATSNPAFLPTAVISLPGDATADGVVNADDYTAIDRGYANHLTGFSNGDFNSDGVINSADYMIIDSFYGQIHGGLSPDFLAERDSEFGDAYVQSLLSSIPEPSLLAVCGLAFPLFTRRRTA
ncbi:MAG TPA: dockerin type I repeat-containing protein [Tepidisphaeraceae bacterium]|jgi:hypothetical protein|nr:dockerin type I repeat-containing protein [Tepidisphaeraceae bacterium]